MKDNSNIHLTLTLGEVMKAFSSVTLSTTLLDSLQEIHLDVIFGMDGVIISYPCQEKLEFKYSFKWNKLMIHTNEEATEYIHRFVKGCRTVIDEHRRVCKCFPDSSRFMPLKPIRPISK